jgi:hypothetical protein
MEYLSVSQDKFDESLPEDFDGVKEKSGAKLDTLEDNLFGKGRMRRKLRKSGMSRKQARKTVRKKKIIRKKLKGLASRALLAPLVPLKGVMVRALKNKGIAMSKKTPINTLAKEFYNKVVVKHSGGNFEEVHFDEDLDHVAGATLSAIASAIVTFIKGLKKKKEEGEPLSKTENIVVSGTEAVEQKIQEKAKEEAAKEVGGRILFDRKTQYIIIGVVILLIGFVGWRATKK